MFILTNYRTEKEAIWVPNEARICLYLFLGSPKAFGRKRQSRQSLLNTWKDRKTHTHTTKKPLGRFLSPINSSKESMQLIHTKLNDFKWAFSHLWLSSVKLVAEIRLNWEKWCEYTNIRLSGMAPRYITYRINMHMNV